jgi:CubicO group peptidase (beta-lactamase class C family)
MVRVTLSFVASALAGPVTGAMYGHGGDPVQETEKLLQELAEADLWSGVATVVKSGQVLHSKGYGLASRELDTEMKSTARFPIGSNSKFFVTVALNQLEAKGFLTLDDAVATHVVPADVGLDEPWCPKLHNASTTGSCVNLTIRQMLGMSSGLSAELAGPVFTDWRQAFDFRNTVYKLSDWDVLLHGQASIADELRRGKVFEAPLQFVPGTKYEYNNFNFVVAAYLVERLSNMTLRDYISHHITQPLGLTQTEYDGSDGQNSILPNYLGDHSYIVDFSQRPARARRAPWRDSIDALAVANGAGGLISPTSDMVQWFLKFVAEPEALGLSRSAMDEMLKPYIACDPPGSFFAQGMFVVPGSVEAPLWPSPIWYIGGIGGYATSVSMWPNAQDRRESDVLAVFVNSQPANIPHVVKQDGNCLDSASGTHMPLVLCDLAEAGSFFNFTLNKLVEIWGLGVWQDDAFIQTFV